VGHSRRGLAGLHEVVLNSPSRKPVLVRHLPPGRSISARRTANDPAFRAGAMTPTSGALIDGDLCMATEPVVSTVMPTPNFGAGVTATVTD
jgi:hypothetical protein